MSGTSADGIDAAACRIVGRGAAMRATFLSHVHVSYPAGRRRELLRCMAPAACRTEALCRLDVEIGRQFARAALRMMRKMGWTARDVSVIGSHGQTICHEPSAGRTWQIGRAAEIAARTGCAVVSDFRSADVALGGQGAPLVPWTDWLLLRDANNARAVQNIGGIANVTLLPAGGDAARVEAFDTGPGNMVMDELVRLATRGGAQYDRHGRRAASGVIRDELLRYWLRHPFFRRRPPKSCGREEFGRAFVTEARRRFGARRWPLSDWLATAAALTCESIARAYGQIGRDRGIRPQEIVLCGGGARNATLRRMLADRLRPARVVVIDELGIPAIAKEALSFALLACACLDGAPANLPNVTGARRPVVLGQITRM